MKVSILAALAAHALGTNALVVYLYSDTNCQNPVPGTGMTDVDLNTCDTGPFQTGWSSARIRDPDVDDAGEWTLTFYTKNNCGCPTCGSHGYSANDAGCLTDFGFTANALGLFQPSTLVPP